MIRALEAAEEADDLPLQAATHRAMALLHLWRGPPDRVRHHGTLSIELAREAGDRHVAFWGHWALAVLEGLTGHLDRADSEIDAAAALAEDLHSPVLRTLARRDPYRKSLCDGGLGGWAGAGREGHISGSQPRSGRVASAPARLDSIDSLRPQRAGPRRRAG